MTGSFDSEPLEFECPDCGSKVRTTYGSARRNPKLRCPRGHEIQLEASQLDGALRAVDKALADFKRSMERLGR